MRTSFAIALLTFVGTSNAVKLNAGQFTDLNNQAQSVAQINATDEASDQAAADQAAADQAAADQAAADQAAADAATASQAAADQAAADQAAADQDAADQAAADQAAADAAAAIASQDAAAASQAAADQAAADQAAADQAAADQAAADQAAADQAAADQAAADQAAADQAAADQAAADAAASSQAAADQAAADQAAADQAAADAAASSQAADQAAADQAAADQAAADAAAAAADQSNNDDTGADQTAADQAAADQAAADQAAADQAAADQAAADAAADQSNTDDTGDDTIDEPVPTPNFIETDIIIGACSASMSSDLRSPTDTTQVLMQDWTNAYSILSQTTDFGWPASDIQFCSDYTLRNQDLKCLTWQQQSSDITTGSNAGDLAFQECSNEQPHLQQFLAKDNYTVTDNLGQSHQNQVYMNYATSTCIGGNGKLGDDCATGVMHRSKIAQNKGGNLRNVGSTECLIPVANDKFARVTSAECDESEDQQWMSFTNGEIVHLSTGYCLGTTSGNTGIFSIQPCADMKEMAFKYNDPKENGNLMFEWMANSALTAEAIDFQGQSVAPRTLDETNLYQYWQFIDTNEWSDAQFTWVEVGCGHGVDMSHSYSEEFNKINADGTKTTADDDYVMSAQDELLGETEIKNAPTVEATSVAYLTETYSQMMNHPSDPTIDRSHLFTCSGEDNCMYRSVMTMSNNYTSDTLEWITGYTRCMGAAPQCPPLTSYDTDKAICVANDE